MLTLLAGLTAGCGKKGAPLAPLYLVPASVTEVSARRAEDAIRLRFVLPAKNQNGPGIDLNRVEIYAITLGPGAATPPNRDLLTKPRLVGEITVKPPPVDGAEPAPEDKRPAPGDVVTFAEPISARMLEPAPLPKAVPAPRPRGTDPTRRPDGPAVTTPPTESGTPPPTPLANAPTIPAAAAEPVRIYVIRGVASNGRPGAASARVAVPLGTPPEAPGGLAAHHTETALVVEWLPSVATIGGTTVEYNIYRADALGEPLNPKPLTTPSYEQTGAPLGGELCFRVRSVNATGSVSVESTLSDPACVTPRDIFPPATPRGLAPVATPGAVNLIWDANAEADLAGYLVLRAEAPDETLQALTPAPIRDTFYRDTSIKPGVRYVYAIVAVDSATPPNRSAPSERADVLAR
jgi:predicted small lipoprotein YifL